MRRRALRSAFLPALVCAIALSLTACGADDDGPSGSEASNSDDAVVLTEDQLGQVLLPGSVLGPSFKESESSDDEEDGDDDLGCLTEVFQETDDQDEDKDVPSAESEWTATTDLELPGLFMAAASMPDVDRANEGIDEFRDAVDGCESVNVTDAEGTTTSLAVSVEDTPYTNLVDEQLTIIAEGSIEAGLEFPFYLELTIARVDNNVALLGFSDIVADAGNAPQTYATALIERLTAVASGEDPTDQLITISDPGDSEGLPSEDSTGAGTVFSKLPFDGGSYTWESGVTMTLSLETVEPYGRKDDFCGDGSCGVALPEDTRVALKYEVSVPENYTEAFDAYGCPGELHVSEGNDDDAFGLVAGDYDSDIGGSILPGTAKFGVMEFYISKEYADSEFYIESSCGDDSYDESAFFAGTFTS